MYTEKRKYELKKADELLARLFQKQSLIFFPDKASKMSQNELDYTQKDIGELRNILDKLYLAFNDHNLEKADELMEKLYHDHGYSYFPYSATKMPKDRLDFVKNDIGEFRDLLDGLYCTLDRAAFYAEKIKEEHKTT